MPGDKLGLGLPHLILKAKVTPVTNQERMTMKRYRQTRSQRKRFTPTAKKVHGKNYMIVYRGGIRM